ncbi:ABC transporter ATP-binding protein [Maritimibacter fusiformis]|uniref:ABC transporter ATP-binding protein n=1 Tax=Maritimibacter fusiformis TaxID=2603819 RepID=A0A5D0RPK4_9RHOB|nr:ABC transporter ATP-binding protein [Maritimibacter fusiformis]
MIELDRITKSYGPIEVLHGIDARVDEGEVFAIIGPNGAGKTTLFKVMTGESLANAGTVRFDGQDVTRMPPHLRIRAGMGRTFQVARVFNPLTALDNVVTAIEARKRAQGRTDHAWWAIRPSAPTRDEAMGLLEGVTLAGKAKMQAADLSHGDRKRLELAVTLAGRPRVLMMDEPTAGMSPVDREQVSHLIRRVMKPETEGGLSAPGQKLTVIMTEHDMSVIFGLASRIMVMNQGKRIALGPVEDIRNDPHVREVYLGKEDQHEELDA